METTQLLERRVMDQGAGSLEMSSKPVLRKSNERLRARIDSLGIRCCCGSGEAEIQENNINNLKYDRKRSKHTLV